MGENLPQQHSYLGVDPELLRLYCRYLSDTRNQNSKLKFQNYFSDINL